MIIKLQNGTPKNGFIINKELPEIPVVPNRLYLYTYYPIVSNEFPLTGHSELHALAATGLEYDLENDKIYQGDTKYAHINKQMNDAGYNFVTNNCADATRCGLEAVTGKKMNPYFFTTPGDVLSFFKENFDTRKDIKRSSFGKDSYYTNISMADFEKIKQLQDTLRLANALKRKQHRQRLALNRKNGGTLKLQDGGQYPKIYKPYYDLNKLLTYNVSLPEITIAGNKQKYLSRKSELQKDKFFRPLLSLFVGSKDSEDSYTNAIVPYSSGPGHERDNIILIRNGKSGEMDRLGMYGAIKGKDGKYRFRNPSYVLPTTDREELKSDLGLAPSKYLIWCAENANKLNLALQLPTSGDAWKRHGIFGDSVILEAPYKKEDYKFGGVGIRAKNLASDLGTYIKDHIDEHDLKTGDIVDMYHKGSDFLNKAFIEGDSNRTNSHTGTILRTGRNREYTYVVHSTGDGLNIEPIGNLLGSGLFKKSYITGIRRPFKLK